MEKIFEQILVNTFGQILAALVIAIFISIFLPIFILLSSHHINKLQYWLIKKYSLSRLGSPLIGGTLHLGESFNINYIKIVYDGYGFEEGLVKQPFAFLTVFNKNFDTLCREQVFRGYTELHIGKRLYPVAILKISPAITTAPIEMYIGKPKN